MTKDELIATLELAAAGSSDLDLAVSRFVCGYDYTKPEPPPGFDGVFWNCVFIEPYTQTFEAALKLLPEGWRVYNLAQDLMSLPIPNSDRHELVVGWATNLYKANVALEIGAARTAPLALCIAGVKARPEWLCSTARLTNSQRAER